MTRGTRPWFQRAPWPAGTEQTVSSGRRPTRSSPPPVNAGITASRRLRLHDGQDFVLGFDLKLRDLSKVTVGASVGVNGLALVFTDDERVLALPGAASRRQADWLKGVLKPVADWAWRP